MLIIQSTLLLDLDFNVHAGRQIELHQSVNSFVCRIDDVHQSLVSSDFKLIAPIAMEEGLRFAIREGGHTVGAGVVSKIIG